jgi:mRNA-degrading endonuclease RelE of RelBE toxin-antitoxin system
MKIHYSDKFAENVAKLSQDVKRILQNKLEIMLENPHHPSLRTKKIKGQGNIFEATVTMGIRITWQYTEDGILLRNIGEHDRTLKDP